MEVLASVQYLTKVQPKKIWSQPVFLRLSRVPSLGEKIKIRRQIKNKPGFQFYFLTVTNVIHQNKISTNDYDAFIRGRRE
ncbi:MAG: hypothetical protein AAF635_10055 [Cyanobacteria bacterium P01_C01_bin.69]